MHNKEFSGISLIRTKEYKEYYIFYYIQNAW